MQEYVSVLGAADERIVKKEQRNAYINVVLSTIHEDDRALMTTVPAKVYELLITQPPTLAIVPRCSDVGRILHYTNKGMATVAEDEIIDFIQKDCKRYTGNKNVNYFTRKRQAERLCNFMNKVLEK